MKKESISLYGFAERNSALLMSVRAEEGIDLVKKYLEKEEFRDEFQVKWIKRRIPDLEKFFAIFKELLSETEKQRFAEVLKSVLAGEYEKTEKEDLNAISATLRRFTDTLLLEQQKGFELLKKPL